MKNQNEITNQYNEYEINNKNEIVWRKSLQEESNFFKTQPVQNIIEQLHLLGFSKPILNDSGSFNRVFKGEVSKTGFNSEMDAYVDCYNYSLENKLI